MKPSAYYRGPDGRLERRDRDELFPLQQHEEGRGGAGVVGWVLLAVVMGAVVGAALVLMGRGA